MSQQGIPIFMLGRSAENGMAILPALEPRFDGTTFFSTLALSTHNAL